MSSPEQRFEHELEVFRHEAETGTQFFYSYLAVHAVAADNERVETALNEAPLFWRTALGGLQAGAFITLGRIFDQGSAHNLDRLVGLAQRNRQIFSKSALGQRKQKGSGNASEWLAEYLSKAYEPDDSDFRRLRQHVSRWRKVYERSYRDLRHKIFAHREISDNEQIGALFAKSKIRELERLFWFLRSLHEALEELYLNGRKPILRPQTYALKRIAKRPSRSLDQVHERVVWEVKRFLLGAQMIQDLEAPRQSRRAKRKTEKRTT